MFSDDYEELFEVFKNFFICLGHLSNTLIKTILFWSFAFLPLLIGIPIGWMQSNIWVWIISLIIEIGWAWVLILSDHERYNRY